MSKFTNLFTQASFADYDFEVAKTSKLIGLSTPSYAVSESTLAGVRGTRFNRALMRKRQVTIELLVRADNEDEYFEKRSAIQAACNKENGEGELILGINGTNYLLNAVPEPPEISWPKYPWFTVQLQFICYDPTIYAADIAETAQITAPGGGGFTFNIMFNIIFTGSGGTGRVTIHNNGNIPTYPTLVLTGPLTNPVVQNETTGEFFALDGYTITAGREVVVRDNEALLDGITNLAEYIEAGSTWWAMRPGENIIRLTTDSTADTGTLQVRWQSAWGQL